MIEIKPWNGRKFDYKGSKITHDEWGHEVEKPIWEMNEYYKYYLARKRRLEHQNRLEQMKEKLEYQMRKYGEVDPIDLQEYVAECQKDY